MKILIRIRSLSKSSLKRKNLDISYYLSVKQIVYLKQVEPVEAVEPIHPEESLPDLCSSDRPETPLAEEFTQT